VHKKMCQRCAQDVRARHYSYLEAIRSGLAPSRFPAFRAFPIVAQLVPYRRRCPSTSLDRPSNRSFTGHRSPTYRLVSRSLSVLHPTALRSYSLPTYRGTSVDFVNNSLLPLSAPITSLPPPRAPAFLLPSDIILFAPQNLSNHHPLLDTVLGQPGGFTFIVALFTLR
jgi:hypothetical protein